LKFLLPIAALAGCTLEGCSTGLTVQRRTLSLRDSSPTDFAAFAAPFDKLRAGFEGVPFQDHSTLTTNLL
jgi:hypothetical protein